MGMIRELSTPPLAMRPYQTRAIREVALAWQERDRTMLVLATGLGKTAVASEILRRRYLAGRGRALFLVHRIELLTQACARLRKDGLGAHVESGDSIAPLHQCSTMEPADVVVATVQTLKGRRLEKWDPNAFGTIVVDEAHHATSASWRAILDRFPGAKILGVTATPDRGDGVAIGGVIDHLAYDYSLRDGITDGYLSPLRVLYPPETITLDMASVRTTKQEHGRDFSGEDLGAQMEGRENLHAMAIPIAEQTGERPTLVFVPTVRIAHALAETLAPYVGDRRVAALDGTTDKDTRASVLAAYARGEVRILVNCALFTEGFDAPQTACVAVARPTKSRALYAQMIGRGTRVSGAIGWHDGAEPPTAEERRAAIAAGAKPDCLVLDLAPSNARHSLVSPVDLLAGDDLPDDALAEARAAGSVDDVLACVDRAVAASKARAAAEGERKAAAHVVARARYEMRERDPFAVLEIDGECGVESGPRATPEMLAEIERSGLTCPKNPSISEARRMLAALRKRRRDGLCTIKQARVLAARGLRKDLSFVDARSALDALASNGWRTSSEIAERWGSASE